ncbi:hypothetical protein A6B40_01845 [Mannheimia varigena]|uniref:hypothetical protein n=1 Tax=Mannheimia varigena TaxID=85404 RepID=UPI00159DCE6E|nr:hypothetical protein [Mannheimia varigena]QLB16418.1 hypothetical protein A6B40_01845 [Mannheimia varigena]
MEKIKMGNFCYFIMLSIITFFTILIFNKIGWVNAGILLVVFFTFFAASIVRKNQEIKRGLEEKELNEWLEKELKRPIVQDKLRHLPPNDIDDEIDTIVTGKVSWTDKEGKTTDLFDIEINIKYK